MRKMLFTGVAVFCLAGCDGDATEPVAQVEPVLAIVDGDQQVSPAGLPVPLEPTVEVTRDGAPQPGVEVLWRVTEGGGLLDTNRIFTDSAGRASIEWTLGEEVGQQLLYASIEGSAGVTFRARSDLFFASVSMGWRHACGLDPRGLVLCWGDNTWGQLGDGTRVASWASRSVTGRRQFDRVYAGMLHTCALSAAGEAWCWGDNGSGQLGDGTTRSSSVPVRVVGGLDLRMLTLGYDHTCGITTGGELYCWGNNTYGQIGDTGEERCSLGGLNARCSRTPAEVAVPGVTMSVAAGDGHTCAVSGVQRAYCLGNNDWGQLGAGRFGGTEGAPVEVVGGVPLEHVTAWGRSTCGLDPSGIPYCWGQNTGGNLGINSLLNLDRPTAVVSPGEALIELDMGRAHTCGRAASGALFCWGAPLGNGSPDNSLVPVEVSGDRDYSTLSVGGDQTCGYADGVWCWGSNIYGQLGVSPESVGETLSPLLVRPAPPAAGGS